SATLTFQTPHNLHTGDHVTYEVPNGDNPIQALIGGAITGLTPGSTYTVVVVNPYQIRLTDSQTPTTAFTFVPSTAISTFTFENADGSFVGGSGFAENDAVTYHAPQPTAFSDSGVGATLVSTTSNGVQTYVPETDSNGVVYGNANVIYDPGNGYE